MESPQPPQAPVSNPFAATATAIAEPTPPAAGSAPPIEEIEFAEVKLLGMQNPLREDPALTSQMELADDLARQLRGPLLRAIKEGKIITASIMIVVDKDYQETFPVILPFDPKEKNPGVMQRYINTQVVGCMFSIREFQRSIDYWRKQVAGTMGFKEIKGLVLE